MNAADKTTVLAVDPGASKCGLALVRRVDGRKLELLWRAIAPTPELCRYVDEALAVAPASMIIVGAGTRSYDVVQALRAHKPSVAILVVDEQNTSMQARERYWEHHRRHGWRRLIPATLQVPPEPVDDFVAMILAERVLLEP